MNIIVVGAGIAGLSTAWSLVKAGHGVTLLEQGATIPNPLAASGDHHRIIRRAYRASTGYGALITEAYDAWSEMWGDLGENHLDPRGFLCVSRKPGDEAEEYREGLEAGGFPFELLDPEKAVEVYRQLLEREPGNERLRRRLEELQAPAVPTPPPAAPSVAADTASRRIALERTIARLEGMLAAIKKG